MLKILQARLQQYVNHEFVSEPIAVFNSLKINRNYLIIIMVLLWIISYQNSPSQASAIHEPWTSMFKLVLEKVEEPEINIANLHWINEKARDFQKNIYFCFIDYAKAIDCVDHNKLWKILKEMGIPDHLTCLLRNLYVSQEAIARTRHGTD